MSSGFFTDDLRKIDDFAPPPSELSRIFAEEPVDLTTFIQDAKFLNQRSIELSPIQFEAVRIIERVYYPELYPLMAEDWNSDYWAEPLPMKNLIDIEWGKGSGKDAVARFASLRVAYLLLCLKSPQSYYGMPSFDSIHLLNIAANAPQAKLAFFDPMREAVKRGWFKDKATPLKGMIQYDKHVAAVSGHSDAEGQEGLNILLGVADEIDAFPSKVEMAGTGKRQREASTSAESILKMLKGSASTRFPRTYKRVTISYPRYLGSTIQRQIAIGNESIKKYGIRSIHYTSGPFATWEVNPRIKGKEDFKEDYDTDPVEAASMYECKPSRSTDAYFRNPKLFKQAVVREDQPIEVKYRVSTTRSTETGESVRVWEPTFEFADDFYAHDGALYAMHADLAIKGDRAGVAMSHVKRWEERTEQIVDEEGNVIGETTVNVPVVRNDFTISFEADASAKDENGDSLPREIQIRWVRVLIFHLIRRGFNVLRVSYDQFQSFDSMQTLERHGIATEKVSTDRDASVWRTVKDVVSDGRLEMSFSPILQIELEGLTRLSNGKVDHLAGASKDEADAFGCSIVGAIVLGGDEAADGSGIELSDSAFTMGSVEEPFQSGEYGESSLPNGGLGMPIGMKGYGSGW